MSGEFPKKGEVFWVALDPTIGSETKKTRPCMIVSSNEGNKRSNLVIVAPLTSKTVRVFTFECKVVVNGTKGKVMLNQIRTIDKSRLFKKEPNVEINIKELNLAIKKTLGL